MFPPMPFAAPPKLPKDAAVLDPQWAEIHRVVKMFASKKYELGAPVGAPSRMVYKVSTGCDQEFSTLVEPVTDDSMPGVRCLLCFPAEEAAA